MGKQHSLIKRKSDVPKAKSGNSSDMVLISPVICPIEQIDTRENESACELGPNFFTQSVSRSPKPVSSSPNISSIALQTKSNTTLIATSAPHSRQYLPPSRPPRPPRHHGAIYSSPPFSPLPLMVRPRRPHPTLSYS